MVKHNFFAGLEAIEFQSPLLYKELTALWNSIIVNRYDSDGILDSEEYQGIRSAVKKHTGLNISIEFSLKFDSIEVELPDINRNNPLAAVLFKPTGNAGTNLVAQAQSEVASIINVKNGMVGGLWARLPIVINMPDFLGGNGTYNDEGEYEYHQGVNSMHTYSGWDRLNGEEIAASFLHEIGHVITYAEYMSNTVVTTRIIDAVSRKLAGADVEEKIDVIRAVIAGLQIDKINPEQLATSDNRTITTVILTENQANLITQGKATNYNRVVWENLADEYVSRMGGGRALATAIQKLKSGDISFRGNTAWFIAETIKFFAGVVLMGVPVVGWLLTYLAWSTELGNTGSKMVYETPAARIKMIRDQQVNKLKNKNLTPEDIKKTNRDIAAIDLIIKGAADNQSWIAIIGNALSEKRRLARDHSLLIKELEDLSANDLFTRASSLRAHASDLG